MTCFREGWTYSGDVCGLGHIEEHACETLEVVLVEDGFGFCPGRHVELRL